MQTKAWMLRAGAWAAAVGVAGWVGADEPAETKAPPKHRVKIQKSAAGGSGGILIIGEGGGKEAGEDGEQPAASRFMIGLGLEDLSAALKAQLQLERGLLVSGVVEKGPADKAGLKVNDILLTVGENEVKTQADVVAAIEKAGEKTVKVVYLRAGRKETTEVTPEKRQAVRIPLPPLGDNEGGDLEILAKAFEGIMQKEGGKAVRGHDILRFHPGVILGGKAKIDALPQGWTMKVTKDSDKPAQIVVEKDGKKFEATEEKLDELPEEIRDAVKRFLSQEGRFEIELNIGEGKAGAGGLVPPVGVKPEELQKRLHEKLKEQPKVLEKKIVPAPEGTKPQFAPNPKIEAKLDEILKRLKAQEENSAEQLRKEVEKLKQRIDELNKN